MPDPALLPKRMQAERHFRWRGGDVSRVEALSDAVFALVLTLLAVSLEVPSSTAELSKIVWQFPAFALCFTFLLWVWWEHFIYHRRFGFEGVGTVWLNGVLLFFVVFFVYPMKFLATALVGDTHDAPVAGMATHGATVLRLFSAGFVGIFATFSVLYLVALRYRHELELDPVELAVTRGSLRGHLLSVAIGVASLVLSLAATSGVMNAASGFIYFLMGPVQALNGIRTGRLVGRLSPP